MELELSVVTSCLVFVLSVLLFVLYKSGTSTFGYFSNQGIPGPKPIPFIGNVWGIWRKNFIEHDVTLVAKFGKVFGIFEGLQPNLIISDPDMIGRVLVEDFDHFTNRRNFQVPFKYFRRMLMHCRDDAWKGIRSSVNPAFDTERMKRMSQIIKVKSEALAGRLVATANDSGKFVCKDAFDHFTMDVIAECVFAMKFEGRQDENELFMKNAQNAFNPPVCKSPMALIPFVFPNLTAKFAKNILAPKEFQYFMNILERVVADRAQSEKKYDDFIAVATESVMETTKEVDGAKIPLWTREEVDEIVIAQSTVFLIAGFDTTASALSNICYLLARNPEVQEKLCQLTVDKIEEFGEVCYEMISDFPYVEQVVKEALRLHPPLPRVDRCCNKDTTYNGIHIKEGVMVSVPVYAVHYSEEYYPEPDKFDPERWAPENKEKIHPHAFLPFGLGPRNCVGLKFAMDEIKLALCSIVTKVKFAPVDETPDQLKSEDGFLWVVQTEKFPLGVEIRGALNEESRKLFTLG